MALYTYFILGNFYSIHIHSKKKPGMSVSSEDVLVELSSNVYVPLFPKNGMFDPHETIENCTKIIEKDDFIDYLNHRITTDLLPCDDTILNCMGLFKDHLLVVAYPQPIASLSLHPFNQIFLLKKEKYSHYFKKLYKEFPPCSWNNAMELGDGSQLLMRPSSSLENKMYFMVSYPSLAGRPKKLIPTNTFKFDEVDEDIECLKSTLMVIVV